MSADHDTAAVLTDPLRAAAEALRQAGRDGYLWVDGDHERVPWESVARWLDERARLVAQPPKDDAQPDEREALADKIVASMARELDHGTRILAASRIAADAVLAAGFRRDPDAGLRERVRALTGEWVRLGWLDSAEGDTPTNHLLRDLVAALAEPTPGSES